MAWLWLDFIWLHLAGFGFGLAVAGFGLILLGFWAGFGAGTGWISASTWILGCIRIALVSVSHVYHILTSFAILILSETALGHVSRWLQSHVH